MNEKKKKKGKTTLHNSNLEFEKPHLTINFFKNIHKSMSSDLSIAKISVNRIAGSKFQFSPSLLSTNQLYLFTTKLFASFYTPLHTLLFHHIHFARTNFLKISITKISTFPYIKKKKRKYRKNRKKWITKFHSSFPTQFFIWNDENVRSTSVNNPSPGQRYLTVAESKDKKLNAINTNTLYEKFNQDRFDDFAMISSRVRLFFFFFFFPILTAFDLVSHAIASSSRVPFLSFPLTPAIFLHFVDNRCTRYVT